MAVNVAIDDIMDAVIAKIATVQAISGVDTTTEFPVRQVDRYLGGELEDIESYRRVIAGRTPAVRVRFAGTRRLRTTIGRRVDRVESSFEITVVDDSHQAPLRRQRLHAAIEKIRHIVAARQYSLAIEPLRYQGTRILRDDLQLLGKVLTFTTKHRVDYTIDPGDDTMDTAEGAILAGDFTLFCSLQTAGTAGTTTYGYRVDGIDAEGARYAGQACRIETGAATLTGSNYITITWEAVDGMASYEVVRTEADGSPATLGTIGATALLTFNDTGLAITAALLPEPYTQEVEVDLT